MRHPLRRRSPWPTLLLALLLLPPSARRAEAQVEVGPNDFRISFVEGTGDPDFDAFDPAVAFNPVANEFLVVWQALHAPAACGPGFTGELEIFAQRVDAATGALLGAPVTVSDAGPPCDGRFEPADPAVDFNPGDDEYLVVWSGDDSVGGLVDNELEIFGQRLTAAGAETGANDFRISDMGGTGVTAFRAAEPAVAFDFNKEHYLVVWWGDDDVGALIDNEFEIFGQRLTAAGAETGANDFRISDMGDDGSTEYEAREPAVVYSTLSAEWLVVWTSDDNEGGVVNGETEIFGQRIDPFGAEVGDNDFRISQQGGSGDGNFDADNPDVTLDTDTGRYLVVWEGNPDDGVSVATEIFGQVLDSAGGEVGGDFRISDLGGNSPDPIQFNARLPAAAYDSADGEFLVAWSGDDNEGGQVAGEGEIYVQRLDRLGMELGANDFRISDMGGIGNPSYSGGFAALAAAAPAGRFLAVWRADDDVGGLVDNEFEVFGQLLVVPIFADGFESGDTTAWTQSLP
jgi:hypothetical protein